MSPAISTAPSWLDRPIKESPRGLAIAIHDLAAARLRKPTLDPNVEHDLREIAAIARRLLEELANG